MGAKIKTIEIQNLKAISALVVDFKGCSAIIIGGNNKGKSTLLSSIPDRIRGARPDLVVKHGEKDGKGILTLTTGEKFEWEFSTEGKDKLVFITKEGYRTSVTKEITKRFFPPLFDIDVFLQASPKEQAKILQKTLGIDFTDINNEYKVAYDERTAANRAFEEIKIKIQSISPIPEEVKAVDVDVLLKEKEGIREKLNSEYLENVKINKKAREIWANQCDAIRKEIEDFNDLQAESNVKFNAAKDAVSILVNLGYAGKDAHEFVVKLGKGIEKFKEYTAPTEPTYLTERPDDSELQAIDQKIANAAQTNLLAQKFVAYEELKASYQTAEEKAKTADARVKSVELRKQEMIEKAKFPAGITIVEDAIFIKEGDQLLPLDKNQLSTSKVYTTALRLAALNLGELKTLHFDASPLDKNTLEEIEKWAQENDMQLLIEKPDWEGGDIKYELIESV